MFTFLQNFIVSSWYYGAPPPPLPLSVPPYFLLSWSWNNIKTFIISVLIYFRARTWVWESCSVFCWILRSWLCHPDDSVISGEISLVTLPRQTLHSTLYTRLNGGNQHFSRSTSIKEYQVFKFNSRLKEFHVQIHLKRWWSYCMTWRIEI